MNCNTIWEFNDSIPPHYSTTPQPCADNSKRRGIIIKELAKGSFCLATAAFCSKITNVTFWSVGNTILDKTDLCFSSYFPNGTSEFFDRYVNYPRFLSRFSRKFSCWMGSGYGPIFEELLDRVLLQEVLLKRLPTRLLQKVSPQHSHLINHPAAKIARISISSIFFALHHSWAHTCTNGDMYPYLLAGVSLGILQEVSGHPYYNMVAHMLANLSNFRCLN